MYYKLVGMIGMVEMEVKEFWDIYKLDVVVIFINCFILCKDQQDFVYKMVCEKYNVVIDEVEKLIVQG